MWNISRDVQDAEIYSYDVGCFSNNWSNHLVRLDIILCKLQEHRFTVKPLKCEWTVKETDWLGYWLTPDGFKPQTKKIDAILHMDWPRISAACWAIIGHVDYYRDMWSSRAYVPKSLTDLSGLKKKNPIRWTLTMGEVFKKTKHRMTADTLAAYPNHNERFDIYTDSSDCQVGTRIIQNGRHVAHFIKKLSDSQLNYTIAEKNSFP